MSYPSKVSLTFAGCGGFFADKSQYQSNFVITSEAPGKAPRRLLFDCGTDAKFSLPELGLDASSFEAVYVSHQHGDHAGGLEWMGFYTYFTGKPKPKLVCNHGLMGDLWEHGLRGPMSTLPGKVVTLSEYFDCNALPDGGWFYWAGILFRTIQTVHVVSGFNIKHSYGLIFWPASMRCTSDTSILPRYKGNDDVVVGDEKDMPAMFDSVPTETPRVLITGDCRFGSPGLDTAYFQASLILHDCEAAGYRSGIHPHYDDLKTLPTPHRNKMLLYHLGQNSFFTDKEATKDLVTSDGFKGVAYKHQTLELW